MGLKLDQTREGFRTILSKQLKQTITHLLPSFMCSLCCSFTFDTQKTFVTLKSAHPMTQKSFNLVNE
jgi:hypothetical protein